MKEQNIFEILHNMDKVTNNLIIQWNKFFDEDLGVSQILVLGHLKVQGRSRLSDIAKALGLTPPTLTHLSNKLVKRNLAIRKIDESNRRVVYLEITDEGTAMVTKANEEGKILRKKLFEKLTEEEIQQLRSIYEKLTKFL
ncbi:MarR family winged helix-turn-helix transcriptional regulator [Fredinandcohnia onubensis]|uniref:MarR family winged helix-turn-helix transcriptional regulator n=1 Tax=Fredinandcohnia onubensis TaxID=1571209 RepID=UPI000C0BD135|nr:MarR family transcriptional regulator [Fredinandcohnia onubensis]